MGGERERERERDQILVIKKWKSNTNSNIKYFFLKSIRDFGLNSCDKKCFQKAFTLILSAEKVFQCFCFYYYSVLLGVKLYFCFPLVYQSIPRYLLLQSIPFPTHVCIQTVYEFVMYSVINKSLIFMAFPFVFGTGIWVNHFSNTTTKIDNNNRKVNTFWNDFSIFFFRGKQKLLVFMFSIDFCIFFLQIDRNFSENLSLSLLLFIIKDLFLLFVFIVVNKEFTIFCVKHFDWH